MSSKDPSKYLPNIKGSEEGHILSFIGSLTLKLSIFILISDFLQIAEGKFEIMIMSPENFPCKR